MNKRQRKKAYKNTPAIKDARAMVKWWRKHPEAKLVPEFGKIESIRIFGTSETAVLAKLDGVEE